MLGHPEAVVAEGFDVLREGDGVLDRLRGRGTGDNRGLVEHREADWDGLAHFLLDEGGVELDAKRPEVLALLLWGCWVVCFRKRYPTLSDDETAG